jgi:O-antigen ligase
MAAPLTFGYLLARAPHSEPAGKIGQRVAAAAKQLGSIRIWLAVAVCVMSLAVVISTSRSGLIGLTAALATAMLAGRWHVQPNIRRWSVLQVLLLGAVVISFANFDTLVAKVDRTLATTPADRGRTAIWRDTVQVIRDFPITGTGAGTYSTAIRAYQTAEPEYSIGQAHNHYLQIAADGGALLLVPCLAVLAAFLLVFARRLRDDTSSTFFIRAGAGAGIAGVLLQSFWETGLRMPANAMLCAALAAVATHRTRC